MSKQLGSPYRSGRSTAGSRRRIRRRAGCKARRRKIGAAYERRLQTLCRRRATCDNNGQGVSTDYATLQEAVPAWYRLAPEQKIRATIKVIGGPVYRAHEIERLHYGPEPA